MFWTKIILLCRGTKPIHMWYVNGSKWCFLKWPIRYVGVLADKCHNRIRHVKDFRIIVFHFLALIYAAPIPDSFIGMFFDNIIQMEKKRFDLVALVII